MISSLIRSSLLIFWCSVTLAATDTTYETNYSRRERHLDHWDAETLAAYLGLDPNTGEPLPDTDDRYAGIDASVMFYAQWCSNCHKFAPIWDTIGQLVNAGTTQSNLIMALFNCELNDQHKRLCDGGGVTHYPTLMFVGAGPFADRDPVSSFLLGGKDKATGPFGATTLKRTVKFQGDLNVGDSVLDWVKAMQGLSKWYKWGHMDGGWLKTIRSLFLNPFEKKKTKQNSQKNALPVGVPPALGNTYSNGSSSSSSKSPYVLQKQLDEAEKKLKRNEKLFDEYQLATDHAGYIIESILFPAMTNTSDSKTENVPLDVFSVLHDANGWDAKVATESLEVKKVSFEKDKDVIMKSCIVDLTLDYCTRLSKKLTTEYLDSISTLSQDEYPSFTEMEAQLRDLVKGNEPFCSMFDECYKNDFTEEKCRPSNCPYNNKGACAYVSSCLSEDILKEYKDALDKSLSADKSKIG